MNMDNELLAKITRITVQGPIKQCLLCQDARVTTTPVYIEFEDHTRVRHELCVDCIAKIQRHLRKVQR